MRTSRFRFRPGLDLLSLRLAPSVAAVAPMTVPGDDPGDCGGDVDDSDQGASMIDSAGDDGSTYNGSATDGAIDNLYSGIPDPCEYTVACAILPTSAIY